MGNPINTNSYLGRRRMLADSFVMLGVGVPIPKPDPTTRHALSYTIVDNGGGLVGYRVHVALGNIPYDLTEPAAVPIVGVTLDDIVGHSASVSAINDTANSFGLPGPNEFDIVVRTLSGTVVQTSGIGAGWQLTVMDRG